MKEHVEKLKQKSMQIRLGRYQNRKAHKQDRVVPSQQQNYTNHFHLTTLHKISTSALSFALYQHTGVC